MSSHNCNDKGTSTSTGIIFLLPICYDSFFLFLKIAGVIDNPYRLSYLNLRNLYRLFYYLLPRAFRKFKEYLYSQCTLYQYLNKSVCMRVKYHVSLHLFHAVILFQGVALTCYFAKVSRSIL